jgi:ArsR family transcriptional regulator
MQDRDLVLVCKALGDPNRLQIVRMLADGEKCACKLLEEFAITQPTLSHHMRVLGDCDLVKTRHEGKWSYYSLNDQTFRNVQQWLSDLTGGLARKESGD